MGAAIPINVGARDDGYRCAPPILRKHAFAISRRIAPSSNRVLIQVWAKRSVPTIYRRTCLEMVGTLRFAHPDLRI
jgi:hypothetical protein